MSKIPTFVIVGRVNKGKSSIVSSLIENDTIAISPMPGTTTQVNKFEYKLNSEVLYQLVDTPGFEQSERLLSILKKSNPTAAQRDSSIKKFLADKALCKEFPEEAKLLKPIMDGGYIIYIVDGSHPYRKNYESEMEILLWTGKKSLALINQIGDQNYNDQWKLALNQYFKIVEPFNAHKSLTKDKLEILRSFSHLSSEVKGTLSSAVSKLEKDFNKRHQLASTIIIETMKECLSYKESEPCYAEHEVEAIAAKSTIAYKKEILRLERQARSQINELFNFTSIDAQDKVALDHLLENEDLFSENTWSAFGLSKSQLVIRSSLFGAMAGAAIDLTTGGLSMLLGTAIGSAVGAISGTFAVSNNPEADAFGYRFAGNRVEVKLSYKSNFGWVLLDRLLNYTRCIAERSHARRDQLVLPEPSKDGTIKNLEDKNLLELQRFLKSASKGDVNSGMFVKVRNILEEIVFK